MAEKTAESASQPRVEQSTVSRAVSALLTHLKKTASERTDIIDGGKAPIFLSLTLKRIPGRMRGRPVQIPLPHSLLNPEEGIECCIIVKDPAKPFKQQLAASPVPGFTKVIGVGKLRKNYKQYKDRLALVHQYDAFFADDRVVRMMPQVCGKIFNDRRKMPLPVQTYGKTWQQNMEKARDSAWFFIGSQNVSIKVGKENMTPEQITENVMKVLEPAVSHMPKKWRNIQRIDIHGANTVMLPVFKSLPAPKLVLEMSDDEDDEDDDDFDLEGEDMSSEDEDEESEEESEDETAKKGKPSSKRARVGEDGAKKEVGKEEKVEERPLKRKGALAESLSKKDTPAAAGAGKEAKPVAKAAATATKAKEATKAPAKTEAPAASKPAAKAPEKDKVADKTAAAKKEEAKPAAAEKKGVKTAVPKAKAAEPVAEEAAPAKAKAADSKKTAPAAMEKAATKEPVKAVSKAAEKVAAPAVAAERVTRAGVKGKPEPAKKTVAKK